VCGAEAAGLSASAKAPTAKQAHRRHAGCCLAFSLSEAFCFPGVSVTSSNTGVPDISGSVYNKTQVRNAGPSSQWPKASLVAQWDAVTQEHVPG